MPKGCLESPDALQEDKCGCCVRPAVAPQVMRIDCSGWKAIEVEVEVEDDGKDSCAVERSAASVEQPRCGDGENYSQPRPTI